MSKITATALERKFETVRGKTVRRAFPLPSKSKTLGECRFCLGDIVVGVGQIAAYPRVVREHKSCARQRERELSRVQK